MEAAGRDAGPAADEITRAVYREIVRIGRDNAATVVLVRLSHPLERHHLELKELYREVVYVDAQATLDAAVPEGDKDAYYRRFGHWRGSPPLPKAK